MSRLTPPAGRVVALDRLRTLTISYVVLYHVALFSAHGGLAPGAADDAPRLLGPVVLATGLWRMPLMFFIAGASTELFLRRRPWREFVAVRVRRLVIPAAFALAVIIPLMRYAESDGRESVLAFSVHAWDFVTGPGGPDWYHLWFVVYLSTITAAALVARPLARVAARVVRRRAGAARASGILFGAAGALTVLVQAVPTRVSLAAAAALGFDARRLIACAVFFAAGIALAHAEDRFARLALRRRRALALAGTFAACAGALDAARAVGVHLLDIGSAGGHAPALDELAQRIACGAGAWFGALAALGYGYQYCRRSSRAVEYLRDASYAVYLLHQAVLAWIARGLRGWEASAAVEYLALVVLTAAATLAVYEYAVRRTSVGRAVFGLPARVAEQGAPLGEVGAWIYARYARAARRLTDPGEVPTRLRNAWRNAASER